MRGLTLIEVLLYTALLGLLLTVIFTSFFPLMSSIEKQRRATADALEASFIIEKLFWVLSQGTLTTPSENATSSLLTIQTSSSTSYTVQLQSKTLAARVANGEVTPLSREDTHVSDFTVFHSSPTSTHMRIVEIMFSINGAPYGPLRYAYFN